MDNDWQSQRQQSQHASDSPMIMHGDTRHPLAILSLRGLVISWPRSGEMPGIRSGQHLVVLAV